MKTQQARLEAALGLDKLLRPRGDEGTHEEPLAMGQGKDKGNHLQEMEETEETGRGAAEVLGNQEANRGPGQLEDTRMGDEAQREGHCQPRQPIRQNREKRDVRPVRVGLPAGTPRTAEPA